MVEKPPYAKRLCPGCLKPITQRWMIQNTSVKGSPPTRHRCGQPIRKPELCLHPRDETVKLENNFGRCGVCGVLLELHGTGFYFEVEGDE